MSSEYKASIIIPTKNGAKYLKEVLTAVFNQQTNYKFEVIIIDSGSKDNTIDIINKFPVKLIQIPPEEFNHGLTRDLGAKNAQGEFLVYLTQDATPANNQWLNNILKNFDIIDNLAGVYGSWQPRSDAPPLEKLEILKNPFLSSYDAKITYSLDKLQYFKPLFDENVFFFSNVNSCLKKSVWGKNHFGNIYFGEDRVWAKKILSTNYCKMYEPTARVYHSHHYSAWQYLKRSYDTAIFNKKELNMLTIPSLIRFLYRFISHANMYTKYFIKQRNVSFINKFKLIIQCNYMLFFKLLGFYLGSKKIPVWLNNKISLQNEIINN